jgi:signal transduction histidine kinase
VPPEQRATACAVLGAYTLCALVLAILTWRREVLDERMMLAAHVGDLSVFAVLLHVTSGAASQLFSFLTFALMGATLSWQWRGVLWTAAACLAMVLSLGVVGVLVAGATPPASEMIVGRVVFLVVATFMLASLGWHQTRVQADLWRLAAYPFALPNSAVWPVREALEYAASVLQAPRALLVWSEAEEPWVYLSLWHAGTLEEERVPPDRFEPLVAEALQDVGFLSENAGQGTAIVHRGSSRFERWRGTPIHPALVECYAIRAALVLPVPSGPLQAHLFVLDDPGFTRDALLIAEAAAGRIGAMLEQVQLAGELQAAAAAAERVRLARELHESMLQSLSGTILQLGSLVPLVEQEPAQAAKRLARIQQGLADQQRELRDLIHALEPGSQPTPAPGMAVAQA